MGRVLVSSSAAARGSSSSSSTAGGALQSQARAPLCYPRLAPAGIQPYSLPSSPPQNGKTSVKCPKIQRLVTPQVLQRKRRRAAIKKERISRKKTEVRRCCVGVWCHACICVCVWSIVRRRLQLVRHTSGAMCVRCTCLALPHLVPPLAPPLQAADYHKLLVQRLKEQRERRSESLAKKRALRMASVASKEA